MLLALDPGANSPGIAIFEDSPMHLCVAAGWIDCPEEWRKLPDGMRWIAVVDAICAWLDRRNIKLCEIHRVVFEKPQWYQRKQGGSKGDPNQLVGIVGVAATLLGRIAAFHMPMQLQVANPTPSEWIGQLSKVCPTCEGKKTCPGVVNGRKRSRVPFVCPDCHGSAWGTPRGRRIRSRAGAAELTSVPDQNDAIDAFGIGLWDLGRLEPKRVYSSD